MIHCNPAASAARLCPIAESPTLTTEPSIKARLEARMVVASTICGWPAVFLVAADRAVATSQHGWRAAYIHLSPAHAGGHARETSGRSATPPRISFRNRTDAARVPW